MTENLTDAELAALAGPPQDAPATDAPEVRPRDFRRPRRLGADRLERIRHALATALEDVEADLAKWLRARPSLELSDVGEIAADMALEGTGLPYAVLAFEVDGLPGWLVWDTPAAIAAVGATLGSPPLDGESAEPRELSVVEASVTRELLLRLASGAARALELAVEAPHMLRTELDLLGTLRASAGRDPHRVYLHVGLDGPGGESTLRLYLPGVGTDGPGAGGKGSSEPALLPEHLDVVPLELAAHLGDVEVPLRELLHLEPGDVIPLGVPAGTPLHVTVEERVCGTADWGNLHGRQVLRLRAFDAAEDDE